MILNTYSKLFIPKERMYITRTREINKFTQDSLFYYSKTVLPYFILFISKIKNHGKKPKNLQ